MQLYNTPYRSIRIEPRQKNAWPSTWCSKANIAKSVQVVGTSFVIDSELNWNDCGLTVEELEGRS